MNILMVCLGNICRSPLAEGVLQHKVDQRQLNWKVDSAGTGSWHIGRPPYHMSQKVAFENGIDISGQRARQLVKEDLLRFDLIYFMDESNYEEARRIAGSYWDERKCRLLMDELYPGEGQTVPDPYGYPLKNFELVFNMIDQACDAIVEKYAMETI